MKRALIVLCLILWPLNLILNFNKIGFSTRTIFYKDYQAEQLILRNIQLYPNTFLARVFQNKGRIYVNKFTNNFFVLTDPNNYFFGLHPQPLTGKVNLFKYPFMFITFFLIGIYYVPKHTHKKPLLVFLAVALVTLSLLIDFEGIDFLLFFPISALIIHGISVSEKLNPKFFKIYGIFAIVFSMIEILRSYPNSL